MLFTLNNAFIVPLYDLVDTPDTFTLVVDHFGGGDLSQLLDRAGTLDELSTLFVAAQLVLALSYLHSLDIVHRDLKPENVAIDARGYVCLAEFGLAKRVADRTHTFCGSMEFLAPEIILQKGYAHAVDWWALGALVYEMLVGESPFYDASLATMFEKILAGHCVFPPSLSPAAVLFVQELLAVDPARRLGSAPDCLEAQFEPHEFFGSLDWDVLREQSDVSPLRFLPPTATAKMAPVAPDTAYTIV
jgi:serine/threonine protein kinase